MKAPAATTQAEAAPGNAFQRHTFSDSSVISNPRTSIGHYEDIHTTSFTPPSYEDPSFPLPEEKECPIEETEQSTGVTSNSIPELRPSPSKQYSDTVQSLRPVSSLPLEESPCALLPSRPAAWIVKTNGLKISPLAASILLNDGILTSKDLTLLYTAYSSPAADQGPSDPISGILGATHRTLVGVLGGVADYPIAATRMATADTAASKSEAASFALDSSKGVSRIVGTAIKAPMEYTVGISQGFHNVPKLWGDNTVRPVDPVTGVSSGLKAAGKGFGMGLYDGITGLVTQPVKGAKEGGVGGAVGGFFKGIGGVVCKPAAGAAGLPAYALKGFYEEYQKKRGMNIKTETTTSQMQQGWEDFSSCTVEERNEVLRRWSQMQSLEGYGGYQVQTS